MNDREHMFCGSGLPPQYRDEFVRSCGWASVTCIVVNAPLIGRLAQTSCERTLGTIAGGCLGFLAYDYGRRVFQGSLLAVDMYLIMTTAAVGSLSCYLAYSMGLDLTPKFFAMTFLLVTTGAHTYGSKCSLTLWHESDSCIVRLVYVSCMNSFTQS